MRDGQHVRVTTSAHPWLNLNEVVRIISVNPSYERLSVMRFSGAQIGVKFDQVEQVQGVRTAKEFELCHNRHRLSEVVASQARLHAKRMEVEHNVRVLEGQLGISLDDPLRAAFVAGAAYGRQANELTTELASEGFDLYIDRNEASVSQ